MPVLAGPMRVSIPSKHGRPRSRLAGGPGLVRLRLWTAMLGLAILPVLGVIVLGATIGRSTNDRAATQRMWQPSEVAADLLDARQAVGTRLVGAAAAPGPPPLLGGGG